MATLRFKRTRIDGTPVNEPDLLKRRFTKVLRAPKGDGTQTGCQTCGGRVLNASAKKAVRTLHPRTNVEVRTDREEKRVNPVTGEVTYYLNSIANNKQAAEVLRRDTIKVIEDCKDANDYFNVMYGGSIHEIEAQLLFLGIDYKPMTDAEKIELVYELSKAQNAKDKRSEREAHNETTARMILDKPVLWYADKDASTIIAEVGLPAIIDALKSVGQKVHHKAKDETIIAQFKKSIDDGTL